MYNKLYLNVLKLRFPFATIFTSPVILILYIVLEINACRCVAKKCHYFNNENNIYNIITFKPVFERRKQAKGKMRCFCLHIRKI